MYLGGPREEAQAQASANALVSLNREFPAWVVVQPGSQRASGFVCLDRHHDGADVEVSFALMPEAQGSGLARAAVDAALLEAWHIGLEQVVAETQTANTRSVRLLEALGFTARQEITRFGNAQTVFAISRPSSYAA
jgi:[ribosomal protein S5]-alanine N-acetyltransferase